METGNNINSNLISIIVPIYNGQDYIDRCVRSIQAQTYAKWELLLMDGASSDKSPAICDEWQSKDARIRAFHAKRNGGVSRGRNTGIREAAGAYLMFVDVDDWLLPDCLQRLYEDIQKPGVQIAGCSFISCTDEDWEKDNRGEQNPREIHKRLIPGKDFLREGILKRDTRCWSKLYERELVEGHFFNEDYTIGEDMLFVWETAKDAEFVSCSDYAGYCYYYNVNGAMLKRFKASDIDQIRCWQFLLDKLLSENKMENKENEIYDTSVISKAAGILLVSCMLVAGKLALLPLGERRQYADIRRQCSEVLAKTLRIEGAYGELDRSYRLKVQLYRRFPNLYLGLYHILKR